MKKCKNNIKICKYMDWDSMSKHNFIFEKTEKEYLYSSLYYKCSICWQKWYINKFF